MGIFIKDLEMPAKGEHLNVTIFNDGLVMGGYYLDERDGCSTFPAQKLATQVCSSPNDLIDRKVAIEMLGETDLPAEVEYAGDGAIIKFLNMQETVIGKE